MFERDSALEYRIEGRNRIMQELHFREKINWPDGYRMAVVLTFDFQGGEDVKPDRNGRINHEEWTQGEYGPQTGI
jgi:hypothetical protein